VTETGIVGVAIDFDRDLQKQEAGRIVAASSPGAIGARTWGAGKTKIKSGTN
jgi:hypothetical protein